MKRVGLIGLILNLLVLQIRSQIQNALREECRVLGCGNCRDLADLGQTICCQGKDNMYIRGKKDTPICLCMI